MKKPLPMQVEVETSLSRDVPAILHLIKLVQDSNYSYFAMVEQLLAGVSRTLFESQKLNLM